MTHRFTRTLPAAGAVLCLGLGLVACTDGGNHGGAKSAGAPSASARASSSAAYRPATDKHPARNVPKPKMTAAARQESFEGAQAFMKYFQDCDNYMIQTGDGRCMTDIVDPSNEPSTQLIDAVKEGYAEGDWIEGGLTQYSIELGYKFETVHGIYSMYVYQYQAPGVQRGKGGRKKDDIHEFNRTRQPQEIWLKYHQGKWILVHLVNIPGTKYDG